jgi:hypothetical protein
MNEQTNIQKENLIADASYRKKRSSTEPMKEGAFKGALASGLAARVIKPKSRMGEAALIGAGTALGSILGQKDHTKKLKLKSKALSTLKKESFHPDNNPSEGSSLMSDALMGGAMGGAMGAWTAPTRGIGRKKWGLISAGIGSLGGVLSGAAERRVLKAEQEHGQEKMRGGMALALGTGGAVEGAASPYIHKGIGALSKNRQDSALKQGLINEIDTHHRGTGLWNKIGKKIGWMDEEKAMLEGTKNGRKNFFNKTMGKRSLKGGLKQGLMGAGVGLGLEHFMNKKTTRSNKEMV